MANDTLLKTYFETGDIPTEAQYAELIDSKINMDKWNDLFNVLVTNDVPSYTPSTSPNTLHVKEDNGWLYVRKDNGDGSWTWIRMMPIPDGATSGQVLSFNGTTFVWVDQTTGGSSSVPLSVYIVGNATIKAYGTGVTVTVIGNVYTITVPSGQFIDTVSIDENNTNINGTDFIVKVVYTGASIKYPMPIPSFLKRDNGGVEPPTSGNPFIYTVDNAPSPQMQLTNHDVGETEITFKNIDNFAKWTAIIKF